MPLPFDLEDAALGDAMSLVVVQRDGRQFASSEVKLAGDAAQYLEDAWARTLKALGERELVDYTPEVVIRAGEDRALVIAEDLRAENEVIEMLLVDVDRDKEAPENVSSDDLYLYAVISDTVAGRIAMIKKKNPTRRAREGKKLFLAGDELEGLEEDPWELHPTFDLVVSDSGGFALSTTFFEQLFADAERLRAKIGPWVDDIAAHLPMADADRAILVDTCRDKARLRRRLRSISHRGHIDRITVADVHRHVNEMGLDPDRYVCQGRLVVDEDSVEELLRMLNEDLTRGGLTNVPNREQGAAAAVSPIMDDTIQFLPLVKAYPALSKTYGEVSCIAGVRMSGPGAPEWIRLYPVPFRALDGTQQFRKYQPVLLRAVRHAGDRRPETRRPDRDSIELLGEPIPSRDGWRMRRHFVEPLMSRSMCEILQRQRADGTSLGVFRPKLSWTWLSSRPTSGRASARLPGRRRRSQASSTGSAQMRRRTSSASSSSCRGRSNTATSARSRLPHPRPIAHRLCASGGGTRLSRVVCGVAPLVR